MMTPLKALRVTLDLRGKELANTFEISSALISATENGRESIARKTLAKGLDNLGIDIKSFEELEDFGKSLELISDNLLNDINKTRLMMLKAMSITETDEELKKNYDALIEMILNTKTQKRRGR